MIGERNDSHKEIPVITKPTLGCYFGVVLLALLVACGNPPTEQVIPLTSTSVLTFTPIPPTPTVPSTEIPSPLPTSPFPLERLRMAFITDGDLYLQDGSNSPTQLTDSGQDHTPIFSGDGEKIIFYRGEFDDLFSINVDGSNEQALVTNDFLKSINSVYDETTEACNLSFAPGTHLLLFNTCSHPAPGITSGNGDLFFANTDTSQINTLFSAGQANAYYISPDGNKIAIDLLNSTIDILSIDGRMIYPSLLTFTPSEPIPLSPNVYWVSDSSEFIVTLPVNTHYDTSVPPSYTFWRYSIDTGKGVQINLDPPLMGYDEAKVSPDGNWVSYNNYERGSFYIGDLRTGYSQLYWPSPGAFAYSDWNPGSTHFIFDATGSLYLGTFRGTPVSIGKGRFIGWLNDRYFLYHEGKTVYVRAINGETIQVFSGIEDIYQYELSFAAVFTNR